MPSFKSASELCKYLKLCINDVLLQEVAEVIKDVEIEHINEDVYDVYSPVTYERRGRNGGLSDRKNIISDLAKDCVLVIDNATEFNTLYPSANYGYELSGLIENGDGWNGYHYDYPEEGGKPPYNEPRPFIQNTIQELKTNKKHLEALKKGLSRKGIKVNK